MGSREIRTRMNSVQNIMKITNAMYLMASSKLKKARIRLNATGPYFNAIQDTMEEILAHAADVDSEYFRNETCKEIPEDQRKRAILVMTSDKGLAGTYNQNVVKMTQKLLETGGETTLLFVGYNGRHFFQRQASDKIHFDDEYSYPSIEPEHWRALYLAQRLVNMYRKDEVNEIFMIYTKMSNAFTSEAQVMRLLPLEKSQFSYTPLEESSYETKFVPSPKAVLRQLVPNYVMGLIYGGMIESYASEQNARMQAMDSATSNAKDVVKELSLLYNRMRQAAITQEITEVVSGAQAQE